MAFPHSGIVLPLCPSATYYGEPWQYSLFQNRVGSVDVSHDLGQRWVVRSRFRATLTNWNYLDVSPRRPPA